jgi:phospholipid transport system substrate-binding protein
MLATAREEGPALSRRARRTAFCAVLFTLLRIAPAPADPPPAPVDAPAALAVSSAAPADSPAERMPNEVIEALQACLLGVMKNAETLGFEGRVEMLGPVLPDVFDLGFMAEKSVGRHWKTASPEDQQRLVSTFTRYIVANYAGRFTGWDGQAFEIVGDEPSARGTMLVRTHLLDPNRDTVSLDYRLRKTDESGWQVIDVYFDGTISELALRRSEYSALIKREGFQALLAKLDERIETLASEPPEEAS